MKSLNDQIATQERALTKYIKNVYNDVYNSSVKELVIDLTNKILYIVYKIRKYNQIKTETYVKESFEKYLKLMFNFKYENYSIVIKNNSVKIF